MVTQPQFEQQPNNPHSLYDTTELILTKRTNRNIKRIQKLCDPTISDRYSTALHIEATTSPKGYFSNVSLSLLLHHQYSTDLLINQTHRH